MDAPGQPPPTPLDRLPDGPPIDGAAAEALAGCVILSCVQLLRCLGGFDDALRTATAPGLPNHAAWTLGHCAMTMHRAAGRLDAGGLPAADFREGADRGDSARFGTEGVCTGSRPLPDPAAFPPLERCTAILNAAGQRLASAIRAAPGDTLGQVTTFFGGDRLPLWAVAPRIVFHNGLHAGQLVDLRRGLGLPPLFA